MAKSSKKQMKIGAILSYLAIFVNIVSALLYSPWMLKMIGSSQYGLYSLSCSLINMFLLDFGIGAAVTRFVAKYRAEGKIQEISNLLGVVYKLFIAIAGVVFVVFTGIYFFIDGIYTSLTPAELETFKRIYVISAFFSVISFPMHATVNGILTAYEKFATVKLFDVIHKIVTVLLIVAALLLGGNIYALVAIHALGNFLFLLMKQMIIRKTTDAKPDYRCKDRGILKEVFSFSVWVLVNSITSRLVLTLCPNILGITAGTLQITIFAFASTLEGYTYTFGGAIDGMFMPKIAKIVYGNVTNNQEEALSKLMVKVGKFQFAVTGLVLAGFFAVGQEFITLWIGAEHMSVYYCALLLMLPVPFYVSQQVGKSAMTISGKIRYISIVNVVKAAVNLVGVLVLSKYWGAVGACISISAVYLLRNAANLVLYKTKLKLNVSKFIWNCYVRMSVPMVLTAVIGYFGGKYIPVSGWLGLLVRVVAVVVVYLVFSVCFLGKNERRQILKKIRG